MEEEGGLAAFRLDVEDEPRFGGHDFVFVDELSAGQTCSICLVAMRDPVQTTCGHRFCESCLLGTFRQGYDQVCPQDRNPIPEDGGFFRDVAWERDILSLRVKCKKSERGCDWTGQLRHYEEHLCEYEDVTCADCDEVMQRRLIQTHTASECRNRIVQCEYCDEKFVFCFTETHKGDECTRFPLDCPQECGVQKIPREEVESHVRDDCMMTMVVCPYEGAGCTFHDKRSDLKTHLEVSSEEHLNKTWSTLLKTTKRLNELEAVEGQIGELKTNAESTKKSLDRNSEEISDLKLSEKKLEVENMTLKKDVTELQKKLEEVRRTTANDQKEISSLKQLVQTMQTSVEAIENSHKPLSQPATLYGDRSYHSDQSYDWPFKSENMRSTPVALGTPVLMPAPGTEISSKLGKTARQTKNESTTRDTVMGKESTRGQSTRDTVMGKESTRGQSTRDTVMRKASTRDTVMSTRHSQETTSAPQFGGSKRT